jgi:type IV pilus assembly protein PilA
MSEYLEERREQGFTLIELLIAIVVVGILAAVAIVGIAGLTNTGSKSACVATKDAAQAASAAYYANQSPNAWPTKFTDMVSNPAAPTDVLTLQNGVVVDSVKNAGGLDTQLDGNGWTLTIGAGGAAPPTFTGSVPNC